MLTHNDDASHYRTLALRFIEAARLADTRQAKDEYTEIAEHYVQLAEAVLDFARANSSRAGARLHLRCPVRATTFDSGLQVSHQALSRIEQIAVRSLCPLCGMTHMHIEKGDAHGTAELIPQV